MTLEEWRIVLGVVMSALLALGPWMFMVHAKLAVVASQVAELGEKVEKAAQANQDLWSRCAQHEVRLQTHDVQLAHVAERLEDV